MLRNCRVHLVPRLYVRNEKLQLRSKPPWIIQTAGRDSNKAGGPFIRFSAGESRTAVSAEAAFVFVARQARREMIARPPLRQTKCRRGHEQAGDESAAGHPLAIAAVAFEHHDGFGQTFIANCSARATTGKGNGHIIVSPSLQILGLQNLVTFCVHIRAVGLSFRRGDRVLVW